MKNICGRLREERQRLGLNQEELALLCGVKKLAQLNYEKGERSPNADYLGKAALAGVDVGYVVTGKRVPLALIEPALLTGIALQVEFVVRQGKPLDDSVRVEAHRRATMIAAAYNNAVRAPDSEAAKALIIEQMREAEKSIRHLLKADVASLVLQSTPA